MTDSDIIRAFNHYKSDSRLHPELLRTGCIERTKIICNELAEKKEEAGYVVVPKIGQGYSDNEEVTCTATLTSGLPYTFKWTNHFVPFVLDQKNQLVVLDMCLMDGPETLKDWCRHIQFQGKRLSPDNCILNHPHDAQYLDIFIHHQDPVERLDIFSSPSAPDNIIPHQIPSKWLQHQHTRA